MRKPVPLDKCLRLMNHGPTVLVSSAHQSRRNLMAAAWAVPIDYAPPKVAVVIESSTYTRELVDASGVFVLNIPSRAQAEMTLAVGTVSGRKTSQEGHEDKFAAYGLATSPASLVEAPLVEDCVAWFECRVVPEPHNQQAYDLFIADVVAAWADDRAFADGRWLLNDPSLRTIHNIAGGAFFVAGDILEAKPQPR